MSLDFVLGNQLGRVSRYLFVVMIETGAQIEVQWAETEKATP